MPPLPVSFPAEARGAVRKLKRDLRRREARWDAMFESVELTRAAMRYNHAGSIGRQRALRVLCRALGPVSQVHDDRPVWTHPRAREGVIANPSDPGQLQDAVVVDYVTIDREDYLQTGLWTLEVPDHALLRLAQRSRTSSISEVIAEAHRSLLAARADPLPVGGEDVLVSAGPGVFIGQLILGRNAALGRERLVYFRARTWLHRDQLGDGQHPLAPGEPSLGSGPLLPMPLRRLELEGAEIRVYSCSARRVADALVAAASSPD